MFWRMRDPSCSRRNEAFEKGENYRYSAVMRDGTPRIAKSAFPTEGGELSSGYDHGKVSE
jgi:hypothetical protein